MSPSNCPLHLVPVLIKDLTFLTTNEMEVSGLMIGRGKIYFPFFLMGTCGDERGVISHNGEREYLRLPKKMDYKWFKTIGEKVRAYPMWDWDWESFKNNILAPNRDHLKEVLNLTDSMADEFLDCGYVFINNFFGSWEDMGEETEEMEKDGSYYPTFKNFVERKNIEY